MPEIEIEVSGSGHPLIFIHGFCEDSYVWQSFSRDFVDRYKTVLVTLPGHGGIQLGSDSFSIADLAKILISHFEESGIHFFTLIGHSLGGYVALELLKLNPEKVKALFLVNSNPFEDSKERKLNRHKLIAFVEKNGVDPFIPTFIPTLFASGSQNYFKKERSEICKRALQMKSESIVAYSLAMAGRADHENLVKEFKDRVYFVGGALDPSIPDKTVDKIKILIPQDHFLLLKNCGHMAMYEAKELTYDFIRASLTFQFH